MNRLAKYFPTICCAMLIGCTQDHAQTIAVPAHNEAIVRGSTAPAAPVQLTYQVPASIAANEPITIDVAINTRLDHGAMLVEIAGHEGVTVLCDTRYRFDLAAVTERPIALPLRVLPADQSERFLAVLVTVDTEMGAMVRSFRIDLKVPAPQPAETPVSGGAIIQQ